MHILLTRPQRQSERFASALQARFGQAMNIVISPVIEVQWRAPSLLPKAHENLVFTSENGVRGLVRCWTQISRTAYCVGDRTARVAQDAGFLAKSAGGSATDLIAVMRDTENRDLYYARGETVSRDLASDLRALGHRVHEDIVYAQGPCDLNDAALAALRQPGTVIAPLFSPLSARCFQAQIETTHEARIHAICLSATVAHELDPTIYSSIKICAHPTGNAMLDRIESDFGLSSG